MLYVSYRHSFGADCFLFSLQPFVVHVARVGFVALGEALSFSASEEQPNGTE